MVGSCYNIDFLLLLGKYRNKAPAIKRKRVLMLSRRERDFLSIYTLISDPRLLLMMICSVSFFLPPSAAAGDAVVPQIKTS